MINNGKFLIIGSLLLVSFSQVLLKKSADKKHKNLLREFLNFNVIFAYCMFFGSMILNIFVLKFLGLKDIQVYMSLSYLLVLLFSKLMLNEKITKKKVIGNLIIVFGIIVFNL